MTSVTAPASQLKAILFDLGETLLDTGGIVPDFFKDQAEEDFAKVYAYLQKRGKPLPAWGAFYDALAGLLRKRQEASWTSHKSVHIGRVMHDALWNLGILLEDAELDECVRLTYEYSDSTAALYPEVLPLIRNLQKRGFRIGMISNTIWPHWYQDSTMERLGVRDLLYPRLYSADLEFKKPHPTIFQRAAQLLNVSPGSTVFVGDHLDPDIIGAQGAGMKAILFDVPYRQESNPSIVPHARITSLEKVPGALDRLYPARGGKE